MKRRGFLGFLGGAAAAGPSVAKAAPKSIGMVAYPPSYGISAANQAIGGGSDWRIGEIANLRRILTGDMTEEEKEQDRRERMYAMESIIDQNVAVLVSVSGPHKLAMRRDRVRKLHKEIRLSETRGYLSRLLKEVNQ